MKMGCSAKIYNWEDEDDFTGNIIYLGSFVRAEPIPPEHTPPERGMPGRSPSDRSPSDRSPSFRRKTRGAGRDDRADTFWNLLFIGLCLSVVVVLFLH